MNGLRRGRSFANTNWSSGERRAVRFASELRMRACVARGTRAESLPLDVSAVDAWSTRRAGLRQRGWRGGAVAAREPSTRLGGLEPWTSWSPCVTTASPPRPGERAPNAAGRRTRRLSPRICKAAPPTTAPTATARRSRDHGPRPPFAAAGASARARCVEAFRRGCEPGLPPPTRDTNHRPKRPPTDAPQCRPTPCTTAMLPRARRRVAARFFWTN
jgi:hypothetical protein